MKKVKLLDSDDDEEDQSAGNAAVNEREAIANELFEGDEDTGEVITKSVLCYGGTSPNHSLQGVTHRSKSIIENVVDKLIVLNTCRYLSIDKFNFSIKVDNHKILN